MEENIENLLNSDLIKNYKMSEKEKEKQRRSFVYGNLAIENPNITRSLINKVAEEMK